EGAGERMTDEAKVDCGWGRLIFGQTYASPERLAEDIRQEEPGRRDVALYIRDPHVVVALAPQQLFLDPSHTFRLALQAAPLEAPPTPGLAIRAARPEDEPAVNRIYLSRSMVPVREGFFADARDDAALLLLVAEDADTGAILGAVTG